MIIRATFANIGYRALAARMQAAGLSGMASPNMGAGDWGVEPGATAEFATPFTTLNESTVTFIVSTLQALHEQAAYVVLLGKETQAFLYWQDGRTERLA